MKKATKKAATSTAAVKVEDKNSNKTGKVAKQKLPTHMTKDDPEWDDYITGLKKNVDDAIEAGLFDFGVAYIGFVDDEELGFPNLFDYDKAFRVLLANDYCSECASNYIEELKNSRNDKGLKTDLAVISKDEQKFCMMQEEYQTRQLQSVVKHMKD